MPNITTCTKCGGLYEAGSEEQANERVRFCSDCLRGTPAGIAAAVNGRDPSRRYPPPMPWIRVELNVVLSSGPTPTLGDFNIGGHQTAPPETEWKAPGGRVGVIGDLLTRVAPMVVAELARVEREGMPAKPPPDPIERAMTALRRVPQADRVKVLEAFCYDCGEEHANVTGGRCPKHEAEVPER